MRVRIFRLALFVCICNLRIWFCLFVASDHHWQCTAKLKLKITKHQATVFTYSNWLLMQYVDVMFSFLLRSPQCSTCEFCFQVSFFNVFFFWRFDIFSPPDISPSKFFHLSIISNWLCSEFIAFMKKAFSMLWNISR